LDLSQAQAIGAFCCLSFAGAMVNA
jgi:hypothetical protein